MAQLKQPEVITLLQELIRIKSPYFHEDEIIDYAGRWLAMQNLPYEVHHYKDDVVTKFRGKNIISVLDSNRPGPVIHLNGHLDTVQLCNGWSLDPFGGEIRDGNIYGVGALDMKSGCAAIMIALKRFAAENKSFCGKIIATLVSDEEGPYGLGTNALIEDSMISNVDLSIVAEPSAGFCNLPYPNLCLGARGGYGGYIELFGKAAHAASPHLGVNAAVDAAKAMVQLEKIQCASDPHLGSGTYCTLGIEADGGACSVPDYAKISFFRHIVTGESKDTIEKDIDEAIRKADIQSEYRFSLRPAPSKGSEGFMPYTVAEDNPYALELMRSIERTSGQAPQQSYFQSIGDFNYLGTRIGAPCIIFGAAGKNYHGPDEFATIDSVQSVTDTLVDFLIRVCSQN